VKTGLCSITFRKLSVEAVVDLVAGSAVEAIEWGGDVHVPHGDLARAAEARRLTEEAGLVVSSYGSYYSLGNPEGESFDAVLDAGEALGVSMIRVWSGPVASADADEAYRGRINEQARELGDRAASRDIGLAFEFHGGSLTDTNASALRLMRDIDHPNVGIYWQPMLATDVEVRLAGLVDLLPWLRNIHAFQWTCRDAVDRRPLSEGAAEWPRYLAAADAGTRDGFVLLEYVCGDDPAQFLEDAAVLAAWMK